MGPFGTRQSSPAVVAAAGTGAGAGDPLDGGAAGHGGGGGQLAAGGQAATGGQFAGGQPAAASFARAAWSRCTFAIANSLRSLAFSDASPRSWERPWELMTSATPASSSPPSTRCCITVGSSRGREWRLGLRGLGLRGVGASVAAD